jgi:hypothetical protein
MVNQEEEKKSSVMMYISQLSKENLQAIARRRRLPMRAIIDMALRGEIDLKKEVERLERENLNG